MAERSIGKAYVQIIPSAEHISGNISKALDPEATAAGKQAGEKITTSMSEKIRNSGEKLKNAGAKLTKSLTVPIVGGFTASAKLASDYGENLNKIDVAFGSSAKVVRKWSDNARTQFGLSKVAASDAVSAFGALGKGIGLSETDAAKMSTTLAGLSADLGSYFNTSNEEASKALEGIFTGESEALKKFGVVMTDTNLEKFAADQGLVWKEMDQSQKTTLRYQYVLAKTKDAQGDYARTSDGTANSIKTFKAALEDLGTIIGEKLLPILTPIIQKITTWSDKFSQLSPTAQKVILIVGGIAAALGPVLSIVGTILTVVPMLGGAFTALAGPVGLVAAAIGAAIAIGVLLYKNWDTIKQKASEIWEAIKNIFITAWNGIVEFFTGAAKGLADMIKRAWNGITDFFRKSIEGWRLLFVAVWEKIKAIFASAAQAIHDAIVTAWGAIKSVFAGIWNGIVKAATAVWNVFKGFLVTEFNGIKKVVTTVFGWIAKWLDFTWGNMFRGTKKVWDNIKSAMVAPIKKARDAIKKIIEKIKSFFNFDFKLPKLKTPHFHIDPPGWSIGDLLHGEIPTLDVDWYAKGGIVDRPTVVGAGDVRGGEGIVPLNAFWERLDAMADNIINGVATVAAAGAGGYGDVHLDVYMYPNGPKMMEETVKMYDKGKKILG